MRSTVPTPADAARRLTNAAAWQWGAVFAGAAVAVLALAGALQPSAAGVAAITAALLSGGAWAARQTLLDDFAMRDELAEIPEVARARRRLVEPKRRREIADALRRIATTGRVSRHDVAPLVIERLPPVRAELLALAEELERAPALDPRTVAEIAGLVTDGARSPLLNRAVPESELAVTLHRIRFRLALGDDLRPVA